MKVLLTGAHGTIGRVLAPSLEHVTAPELPEYNLAAAATWQSALPGHDAVIHLAWNQATSLEHEVHPDNFAMADHLFRYALAAGVKRVVYASSVHADDFYAWTPPQLITPVYGGTPTGAYGAAKLYGEAVGRRASAMGLEVICLRFGGVNAGDLQPEDVFERSVWLSHDDCRNAVNQALTMDLGPSRYLVAYAVSPSNPHRRHETAPVLPMVVG